MKTKEELAKDINDEIVIVKRELNSTFATEESSATNRVAISNLYIALSNLLK